MILFWPSQKRLPPPAETEPDIMSWKAFIHWPANKAAEKGPPPKWGGLGSPKYNHG